jgi:hypothetical protein
MNSIYNSFDVFVIHVDAKVNDCIRSLLVEHVTAGRQNVFFTQRSINVKWGRYSIVEMTLELVRHAVKLAQESQGDERHGWDFVINLCGNSRAVTSSGYRRFLLSQYPPNTNFMGNMTRISDRPDKFYHRTPARCLPARSKCVHMTETPQGNLVYKGGQWFILSRSFANYLYEDKALVPAWENFFSDTWTPDESFFQSVLLASPHRASLVMRIHDKVHKYKVENPIWTSWKKPCLNTAYNHNPCYLGLQDIPYFTGELDSTKDSERAEEFTTGVLFIRKVKANESLDQLLAFGNMFNTE